MMTIIVVLFIQYTSCVMLHHSNPKRTQLALLINSSNVRLIIRSSAVLMLLLSLSILSNVKGWELGIPIWLCLIAVTGLLSLFTNAYFLSLHVRSGVMTLVVVISVSFVSVMVKQPPFGLLL